MPGALWSRKALEDTRVKQAPELARIVVAIDPPATSGEDADECGIVVAGRSGDWQGYVLEDLSSGGLTPEKWARRALHAFHKYKASAIVVEVNNGGEMATAVLQQVDPTVPIRAVHATRGKYVRPNLSRSYTSRAGLTMSGHSPRLKIRCAGSPWTAWQTEHRLTGLMLLSGP